MAAYTLPSRVHPTERVVRWSCSSARLVVYASGKGKQRTFRATFGTDRAVETKQEVLEKVSITLLPTKESSFVRQNSPVVLARHQGRIQSCRSKTKADYLRCCPQVPLGRGEKVHAEAQDTCPCYLNQIARLIPGSCFWIPPFFSRQTIVCPQGHRPE